MRLSEIRDQEAAIGTLRRALATGKVPHAYLFEGPPGVGKLQVAEGLAMALICESSRDGDACGECAACRKISRRSHPDVFFLKLPEGKRRIPIESVREIERWLVLRPHEGPAKVVVIDPADRLSEPAANALLKTLEEPRRDGYIALVTAAAAALLPTVRSRCQRVRFGPLSRATVAEILEGRGMDPDRARIVAALSAGSMDRADRYAGEDLPERLARVSDLLAGAGDVTPERGLAAAASIRGDRDEAEALLGLALLVLQEALRGEAGGGSALSDRLDEGARRALAAASPAEAARRIAPVHRAISAMQRNNMNPQLALEAVVATWRGAEAGRDWNRIGAR